MAFWPKGFGRGRSGSSAAGLHSRGYSPQLSASEISRGLTSNADLHLRQHYDEHIAWDADKEESRVWRRTMYTFPDWKKHRSSYRYVHHMHTILESRIVRGLLRPVLVLTLAAAAVAAYQTLHAKQLLLSFLPALPILPIEPFQLTSFALSLLLVFRTNSSYGRWNEGRRRFGRITTTCRDICRQVLALVPRADVACRALFARWLVAFCRASKWYIREDEPLEEELAAWLEPSELSQLVTSPHPPNFCILVLSHAVSNSGLDQFAVVRLQEALTELSINLSACDRILNTPIPLSYTRHTARFLILWLLLLPLALWGSCGWLVVPTVAVISFVLLGIEEIGVQIEEPFSILALENLCKKAERHISGMMLMDETTYNLHCPAQSTEQLPDFYGYEVVAEYAHDPYAFTQGLQFDNICERTGGGSACKEVFWESTGMYGESTMRAVQVADGRVLAKTPMASQWFGEGATRLGDKLYQITWLSGAGFIYSVPDLKQVGTFTTPLNDGWGLTTDGNLLVASDGSEQLFWLDPANGFKIVKQMRVMDGSKPVFALNELEFIGGEVWANVWQTNCIARICPETGKVKGWLLMHGLRQSLQDRNLASNGMDVLNGIAWDHHRQRLFITGKYWPRIFEVVPVPVNATDDALAKRQSCFVRK
ncbi:hypothetical protein OEZ86_000694 [Tetradesmus obliquus]|nr:hypothetical protein OEZ86_000694 [Tetradesmus obliquus]